MVIEPETLEQRVMEAARPMEAKRFSLEMDTELNEDGEKDQNKSPDKHVGDKVVYELFFKLCRSLVY